MVRGGHDACSALATSLYLLVSLAVLTRERLGGSGIVTRGERLGNNNVDLVDKI